MPDFSGGVRKSKNSSWYENTGIGGQKKWVSIGRIGIGQVQFFENRALKMLFSTVPIGDPPYAHRVPSATWECVPRSKNPCKYRRENLLLPPLLSRDLFVVWVYGY